MSDFRKKFDNLLDQMTELTKNTPPDELEQIVALVKKNPEPIICTSRKDFNRRLLTRISGVSEIIPLVIKNHDGLSDEEIVSYENSAHRENRLFILPSIVKPVSKLEKDDFYPYIVFFTHDSKMLVMPYTGSEFSDDYEYVDEEYSDYEDDDDYE